MCEDLDTGVLVQNGAISLSEVEGIMTSNKNAGEPVMFMMH